MLSKGRAVKLDEVHIDDTALRLIETGREALERLRKNQTWDDYKQIGYAVDAGRKEIMRYLQINEPSQGGKAYTTLMSDCLTKYGFRDKGLDNSAFSRLQKCIENMVEIEAWRASLSETERLKYNHPNTVWSKFQGAAKAPRTGEPPKKENAKDVSIRELQEKLDETTQQRDEWRKRAESAEAMIAMMKGGGGAGQIRQHKALSAKPAKEYRVVQDGAEYRVEFRERRPGRPVWSTASRHASEEEAKSDLDRVSGVENPIVDSIEFRIIQNIYNESREFEREFIPPDDFAPADTLEGEWIVQSRNAEAATWTKVSEYRTHAEAKVAVDELLKSK